MMQRCKGKGPLVYDFAWPNRGVQKDAEAQGGCFLCKYLAENTELAARGL